MSPGGQATGCPLANDDEIDWEKLVERIRCYAITCARCSGMDIGNADDVAQETAIALLERFRDGKYNAIEIERIASKATKNKWIDHVRAIHRSSERMQVAIVNGEAKDCPVPPGDYKDFLEVLFTKLESRESLVLEGRLKGNTFREIASIVGCSLSTVGNLFAKVEAKAALMRENGEGI